MLRSKYFAFFEEFIQNAVIQKNYSFKLVSLSLSPLNANPCAAANSKTSAISCKYSWFFAPVSDGSN